MFLFIAVIAFIGFCDSPYRRVVRHVQTNTADISGKNEGPVLPRQLPRSNDELQWSMSDFYSMFDCPWYEDLKHSGNGWHFIIRVVLSLERPVQRLNAVAARLAAIKNSLARRDSNPHPLISGQQRPTLPDVIGNANMPLRRRHRGCCVRSAQASLVVYWVSQLLARKV